MKGSKFREGQVLAVWKAVESGRTVAEVYRETGIPAATPHPVPALAPRIRFAVKINFKFRDLVGT